MKAKFAAPIFALLAILSVNNAHATNPEPIICEESGGSLNTSDESEDVDIKYGKMTIQFDQKRNPIAITVDRIETPQIGALKFELNSANARISTATVPHVDDAWGIESHVRITAFGSDGSSIVINLDDHRYAGVLSGSTVEIKKGNEKVLTSEIEHQVICLTPSEKVQYEKDLSGAME